MIFKYFKVSDPCLDELRPEQLPRIRPLFPIGAEDTVAKEFLPFMQEIIPFTLCERSARIATAQDAGDRLTYSLNCEARTA